MNKNASAGRHFVAQGESGAYWVHVSVRGGIHEHTAHVIQCTIDNWVSIIDAIKAGNGDEVSESTPEMQVAEFYNLNKEQRAAMFDIENHVTVWGAKWSKWADSGVTTAIDAQETSFTIHSDSSPNQCLQMARVLMDVTDMSKVIVYEQDEQVYIDDDNQDTEVIEHRQQPAAPVVTGITSYPLDKEEREELEAALLKQENPTARFAIGKIVADGTKVKFHPAMGASGYTKFPGKMSIGNIDWVSNETLKTWLRDKLMPVGEYDIMAKHNCFWYIDVTLKANAAGTVYWNVTNMSTK